MTPRQWQYLFMGLLVVAAVLLQVVVVARLPLPGPPVGLPVAVVVAIGMAGGVGPGAASGFAAGLLLDVLPPSTATIGSTALALLVVGALAGRIRDPRGLAPAQLAAVAAGLAGLAWGIGQILARLLGDSAAPPLWGLWFAAGTAVLALAVVPATTWAIRGIGHGHRRRRSRPRSVAAGRP